MTAATAKITGGDLNARAEVLSHDEIGLLAVEFNRMAEHIRQLRRSDLGKLLVAQQTTEAAIDSLYDPVLVTDARGRVTKLNPAAEDIFGAEAWNTGRYVWDIAQDDRIAMAVAEALRSQRPVAGEGVSAVLPLRIHGVQHAFRLRTTPMHDEEGHLLGAVMLLEDITHLREIDRLKSEFIATASHELRTPLTSVQMGIHLLLEGAAGALTAAQRDLLSTCREDCERLEKLMRDLLDLTRIEAGESPPQMTPSMPLRCCAGPPKRCGRRWKPKASPLALMCQRNCRVYSPTACTSSGSWPIWSPMPYGTPRLLARFTSLQHSMTGMLPPVADTGSGIPPNTCRASLTNLCRYQARLRRCRTGPGHLKAYHRSARRTDQCAVRTGAWHHVYVHLARARRHRRCRAHAKRRAAPRESEEI